MTADNTWVCETSVKDEQTGISFRSKFVFKYSEKTMEKAMAEAKRLSKRLNSKCVIENLHLFVPGTVARR